MNISSALINGAKILKEKHIYTANLDSEILMSKAINKDRKYILINSNKKINTKDLNYFDALIQQRSSGKPIAYLINKKSFWNSEFFVNHNTLIPRPDSELIVENALKLTRYKKKIKILDIGVGSGCILLSILKEKKHFYGTGIDISKKCLNICKKNAIKLKMKNRLKLFKSDIDKFTLGKYDLIVANPPYINKFSLKYLDKEVINFEPRLALDGGLDGLSEIRKVINKSAELIKKNGKLILEIAFNQRIEVKKILENNGFYVDAVIKDLAKNDRCIISKKI